MQPTTILFSTLLPILAAASPLDTRAGGPAAVPIPQNCTVINPLPHAKCGHANVHGFMPTQAFTKAHGGFQSFYTPPLTLAAATKQCFEQCYGFGTPGTCKSVIFAQNVPTPKGYFGTPGGQLMSACLMFNDYLDPLQFTAAPSGQYVNATAANIYCPS